MSQQETQSPSDAITAALDQSRAARAAVLARLPLGDRVDDETLRRGFRRVTRVGTRLLNRFPLRELLGVSYGLIGPRGFVWLAGIKRDDPFESNVVDYLKLATLWGVFPVEILSDTGSRLEVAFRQCPLGIERASERRLCSAYMALEPKISDKPYFGTRISVLECIPDGQGRCRLQFEAKQ